MKIKHSTSTIVNPQENPYSEDLGPPPSPTHIIKAAVVASPTGKHPLYKGIRSRGMKWVSEIREPHKTTRIWLGTYATPEMAAAAYDAASLALKGPETVLNFPHHKYNNYNVNLLFPASTPTAAGIRMAAANAAASRAVESESLQALPAAQNTNNNNINVYSNISSNALLWNNEEYVDEEELYYMPNLLMNMAEGMLISPPRDAVVLQPSSGDEEEFMWSYS